MSRFYIALLLILSCKIVPAQWISGTVTDYNLDRPASGVSVTVEGTPKGTVTDIDGKYRIEIDTSHTALVFSWYGRFKLIEIGNDSVINVSLKRYEDIDEFVIIAVGVPRPISYLFGSIGKKNKFKIRKSKRYTYIGPDKDEIERENLRRDSLYRAALASTQVEKRWDWNPKYAWNIMNDPFFRYIFDNVNYPELAIENGISGIVIVDFEIDLDGNVKNVELVRGTDKLLDFEVLSAFRSAPQKTDYPVKESFYHGLPKYYVKCFRLFIRYRLQ
jgi:TonB family protein